jgi:Caspase domain/WD domain, G-beta repeat
MRLWLGVLFTLAMSAVGWAESQPDQSPFLRIETGTHLAPIRSLEVTESGDFMLTASLDKTARLWSLPQLDLLKTFRLPIDWADGGQIYSASLSQDRKLVAFSRMSVVAGKNTGHSVFVYSIAKQNLVKRLGPIAGNYSRLRFISGGSTLLIGSDRGILAAYSTKSWEKTGGDPSFEGAINTLEVSSDNLVAVGDNNSLKLYDSKLKLLSHANLSADTIAFSPNSKFLAAGRQGYQAVQIVEVPTLKIKFETTPNGMGDGVKSLAWSADGATLYGAGASLKEQKGYAIMAWHENAKATRVDLISVQEEPNIIRVVGANSLVFGLQVGSFGLVDLHTMAVDTNQTANFLGTIDPDQLAVSEEGVSGRIESDEKRSTFTFDVRKLLFGKALTNQTSLHLPDYSGVEFDYSTRDGSPYLANGYLDLEAYEAGFSTARTTLPDKSSFIFGTTFNLHSLKMDGNRIWRTPVQGGVISVNSSTSGKLVVAVIGEGTMRWYRARDGRELFSFYEHPQSKNWVLWTRSGYYAASPGGEDLIGWHLNGKTFDEPVDFFPASRFRDRFYRPDIVKIMLETLDEKEAVKQANKASGRSAEKPFSRKILPPVISINADPRGLETDAAELDVDYLLRAPSGREVSKIEVRVDGRLFATETVQGLLKPSTKSARSLKVPLPKRDAEVSVVAFHGDQAGEPSRIEVRYTGAPAPTAKTTLRALLVGVSEYNNKDLTLNYADNDASDLARVLKEQEGRFFKSVETTVLLDGNASEANIQAALADLAAKTGPDDYAVVFLAGHGLTEKNRFYFVPADANVADGKLADVETAVAETTILKALSNMRGKVLFFVDACFSAGVIKVDSTGFVNAITSEENAVMMYSSSQGDEVSFEDPKWENGAFTEALMQIFADPKSYNANGEINTDDLARKLKERVRALTGDKQNPVGQSSRAISPFPVMGL